VEVSTKDYYTTESHQDAMYERGKAPSYTKEITIEAFIKVVL
jgi:hypothetical protein